MDVYNKNKWVSLKPGDELIIPENTPHSFRSRSDEDCLFEYALTPGCEFTNMLKTFERLMKDGRLQGTSGLKSKIYLSMVFKAYSNELISVKPPQFVISTMAKIGKLRGFTID